MDRFPSSLAERFTPERVLGEGSYGVVYLAREVAGGRPVALKVLSSSAGDESAARFSQEAQVLATLDHPGIVRLVAWGSGGARLWLAMEYVEGETLRERLERTGAESDPARVAALLAPVGAALDFAHGKGVLHRDVKPENLLLTPAGAKLLDFGLAKMLYGTSSVRTRAGLLVGTPAYMAPERIRGDAAGPSADIYALAVLAYELLAGRPPFTGDPIPVVQDQLRKPPPPLPPAVPAPVAAVVLSALAKEIGDRPATSAGAFVTALGRAAAGETKATVLGAPAVRGTKAGLMASAGGGGDPSLAPTSAMARPLVRPAGPAPGRVPRLALVGGLLLAACGLFAWARRGPSHGHVPAGMTLTPGVEGVEIRFAAPPPADLGVLVLGLDDPPPARLGEPGPPARDGTFSVAGLKAGTAYRIWLGRRGEVPVPVGTFETPPAFKLLGVRLSGLDPPTVRIRAEPAFSAAFRPERPGEAVGESAELVLPPAEAGVPVLRVRTPGSGEAVVAGFPEALAQAVDEALLQDDPAGAVRELFAHLGLRNIQALPIPALAGREAAVRDRLLGSPRLARAVALGGHLARLAGDPDVAAPTRLRLARRLAGLVTVDASLDALGAGAPGPEQELSRGLAHVLPEVAPPAGFVLADPPLGYRGFELPTDDNNLVPRGLAPDLVARYHQGIRAMFPGEKEPREKVQESIVLAGVPDGASGRLVVVARVTHPESVLHVELNGVLDVPLRWRESDGATRGLAGIKILTTMSMEATAPLRTRVFELPPGVLRAGPNVIELWYENHLPEPDGWLPTVHGVALKAHVR